MTAVPPYIDPSGPFDSERDLALHLFTVRPDPARLADLLGLAARGLLPATIEQTYPFEEAAAAHRRQSAGGLSGRVLLIP